MMQIPTSEEIAKRAYAIYLSRGAEHGHDVNDWLQAEAQLKRQFAKTPTFSGLQIGPLTITAVATESVKSVTKPTTQIHSASRRSARKAMTHAKAA
jgi:Protein of unknown function (DUF2934)